MIRSRMKKTNPFLIGFGIGALYLIMLSIFDFFAKKQISSSRFTITISLIIIFTGFQWMVNKKIDSLHKKVKD